MRRIPLVNRTEEEEERGERREEERDARQKADAPHP
jgi:hypothetical protein